MNEFLDYVRKENNKLLTHYGFNDKKEAVYPQMLKLMEEVGELSEAVLQNNRLQRSEKLNTKKTDIAKEIIDSMFVLFLIADSMDIDVVEEMKVKCKETEERKL